MPCFKILTNIPRSNIPKDFMENIVPLLANLVRKPAANFICVISTDCIVTFGGKSLAPGAIATLESIGHISPEDNKVVTKGLTEFIEKELGIEPDRFFLSFYDVPASNIGKGGIIMSEIYG